MVCLPTFTIQNHLDIGKYTMDASWVYSGTENATENMALKSFLGCTKFKLVD